MGLELEPTAPNTFPLCFPLLNMIFIGPPVFVERSERFNAILYE